MDTHLLRLIVRDTGSAFAPLGTGADAEPIVWKDKDGTVVGSGYVADGSPCVELHGIARFRLGRGSEPVLAEPLGAPDELVEDVFRRWILPVAVQVRGAEVLHASAVVGPKGVLAFCAASEAGKSTLAYAFSRRDHELFADDAVAFEVVDAVPRALPLPYELRLRPSALAHFGLNGDSPRPAGQAAASVPIAAVFLLRRGADGPAVEPVPAAGALPALLEQSYHFGGETLGRKRAMLSAYLGLAAGARVEQLTVPSDLGRLDETLDAVAATL